ncbi:hypothetical protein CMI37_17385 [Candidatus Pacearchaeota archaeon]|nr:hypothetical protein [Candidatus Pacearchaeota archaeon]
MKKHSRTQTTNRKRNISISPPISDGYKTKPYRSRVTPAQYRAIKEILTEKDLRITPGTQSGQ